MLTQPSVVDEVEQDAGHFWNSVGFRSTYNAFDGDKLSWRQLVKSASKHFGP